ncbi:MAG: hypothetical protein VB100_01640 [Angelakisella sp.]|nr:hypothetical protein [Angelakisella sp.]
MKLIMKITGALLAVVMLAACGSNVNPKESDGTSTPPVSSSRTSDKETESQEQEEPRTGAIPVMDAAFYRGTITEIKDMGGTTVFTLLGAPGAGFGPAIDIAFGDSPQIEFNPAELKVGDQVEAYYGVPLDTEKIAYYNAISAVKLFEEAATNYNGIVVEIVPGKNPGEGRLVMKALDAKETTDPEEQMLQQFVFNYGSQTRWVKGLSPQDVKPGDKLNIYHRGIATMSIPPQGIPLEIRVMAEDERLAAN